MNLIYFNWCLSFSQTKYKAYKYSKYFEEIFSPGKLPNGIWKIFHLYMYERKGSNFVERPIWL